MTYRKGFTLVELLLAITIVATMASTLYGSFARALESKEYAEGRARLYGRARLALSQLSLELQGVGPPRPGRPALFRLEPGPPDDYPTAQLSFVTLAPVSATVFPGLREIQYLIEPDAEGGELYTWLRREMPALPASSPDRETLTAETPAFLFVPDVAGLSVQAFDGRQWVKYWDRTTARGRPPSAIAVTLYLVDRQGEVRPFSAVIDLPLVPTQAPLPPPPHQEAAP